MFFSHFVFSMLVTEVGNFIWQGENVDRIIVETEGQRYIY